MFAQTGGVLFNDAQRAALEAYIRGGGGYMGLHYTGWSVGQSEHDVNPFYPGSSARCPRATRRTRPCARAASSSRTPATR